MRRTADKAAKGITSLSRFISNIVGLKSRKRRLLMTAVESVLLYGAELLADALDKKMYRNSCPRYSGEGTEFGLYLSHTLWNSVIDRWGHSHRSLRQKRKSYISEES